MILCTTQLSNGETLNGELMRPNFHTVLMKVYCPKKKVDKVIKRHKKKHYVDIIDSK